MRCFCLAVAMTLVFASSTPGARIYLSDSDTIPALTNPMLTLVPNASSSLYVWVSPEDGEVINGLGLSLRATDPTLLRVSGHEVF